MTQAQPLEAPTTVRMVVCGECRPKLEARGAVRVPGPHVLDLDGRCEAHGRTGALAGAHVLEVTEALRDELEDERRRQPLAPLRPEDGDELEDAPIVAQLAVSLIVGQHLDPTSDDAILISIRSARAILSAARGK